MIGIALTILAIIFLGYIALIIIGGLGVLLTEFNPPEITHLTEDEKEELQKLAEANQLASNAGLL